MGGTLLAKIPRQKGAGWGDAPCQNSWTKGSGLGGGIFLAKIPGQKGAGWGEGLSLPKFLDKRERADGRERHHSLNSFPLIW